MKKILLPFLLLLFSMSLKAQINPQLLYNTWIKVKVTYNDDKPLVYANTFKYSYAKYIFSRDGKAGINAHYASDLANNNFMLNDSIIIINTPSGFQLNKLKIAKLTTNELVLIEDDAPGSPNPYGLKIFLVTQKAYQESHKFKPDEYSISANGDTVYNESMFVYPYFNGGENLQTYLLNKNTVSMSQQAGHFLATFLVDKTGRIDSLKIVNGINADYDKLFLKNFAKCQLLWKPAILNGKTVSVKAFVRFDYWGADIQTPAMRFNEKANEALNAGNFETALHYYEGSLSYLPNDITNIYKAALCKLALGRTDGVCEALAHINRSGEMNVDELIGLVCSENKTK